MSVRLRLRCPEVETGDAPLAMIARGWVLGLLVCTGCAGSRNALVADRGTLLAFAVVEDIEASEVDVAAEAPDSAPPAAHHDDRVAATMVGLTSHQLPTENLPKPALEEVDVEQVGQEGTSDLRRQLGAADLTSSDPRGVSLLDVATSVHDSFPLLEAAYLERSRTAGEELAARGAFDTQLKASTQNRPLGFYETYRHGGGITQPLYRGGEVYAGYRLGRGNFEPWYQERETNAGGELTAGFLVPLARNREIDARRAALWRATYERRLAEPEIRLQLIGFVRDASVAYWNWVAASRLYEIGQVALEIADERNTGLQRRVETGDVDPPVLQDNQRAIAERRAKLAERRRQLQQSALELSLYLRGPDTDPIVPPFDPLPQFPEVGSIDPEQINAWLSEAVTRRPELASLAALEQRTRVDLAEALNDLRPNVDAGVLGAQDVGEPTSSTRDKSEFELELGLYVDVPIQRRKGYGKARAARAELAQLDAKRRFVSDKISTEVQSAIAGLEAAYDRVEQTRRAIELAEALAGVERRKFGLGESDLLNVFLREQFAIEAADNLVLALLDYQLARTELAAAMGLSWPLSGR